MKEASISDYENEYEVILNQYQRYQLFVIKIMMIVIIYLTIIIMKMLKMVKKINVKKKVTDRDQAELGARPKIRGNTIDIRSKVSFPVFFIYFFLLRCPSSFYLFNILLFRSKVSIPVFLLYYFIKVSK